MTHVLGPVVLGNQVNEARFSWSIFCLNYQILKQRLIFGLKSCYQLLAEGRSGDFGEGEEEGEKEEKMGRGSEGALMFEFLRH